MSGSLRTQYLILLRIHMRQAFIFTLFVIFYNCKLPQAYAFSIEAYGQLESKSLFTLSPSGDRLAYRDTSNGSDIIQIIDLKKRAMIAGIDVSSVKPNLIHFVSEDTLVFVASQNIKRKFFIRGARTDVSVAVAYNIKAKTLHQLLTPGYGISIHQTNLGIIYGISDDSKHAFMLGFDKEHSPKVYKVNLTKKKKPQILLKAPNDAIGFFLNGNGEALARERFNNEENLHIVESYTGDEWIETYRHKTSIPTTVFSGLTSDKEHLVMVNKDSSLNRTTLNTLSLTNGDKGRTEFSRDDKDIEFFVTDINRVVYGILYSGFTPSYQFFDKNLNMLMQKFVETFSDKTISLASFTGDFSHLILYMQSDESAGDYFSYSKQKLEFLGSSRPDITPEMVNPIIEYEFSARDGMRIPTLLTVPNGFEAKNLPAIILPHGGPALYDKKEFNYLSQYFASQGYLVIQPQYRGSTGFGFQHTLAGRGEWGRKMQDDLSDAIEDLAKTGKINSNRVCIIGASYGGYAALAGAAFTPDLYKCAVSINGVSDISRMMHSEKLKYGEGHWVVAYWQDIIAEGHFTDSHLIKISPINSVNKVKAPILLIHGEYDGTVPYEQSEKMLAALKTQNKDVTFVRLDGGDHYLSTGENRIKAMKAIDKFIKKHMKEN